MADRRAMEAIATVRRRGAIAARVKTAAAVRDVRSARIPGEF